MRFFNPTRIEFGPGASVRLKTLLRDDFRAKRPYLITDTGIRKSGIVDRVMSGLSGIPVFDAVASNPRHSTVNKAAEAVRAYRPDAVVALGGGSALDAGKAVALLAVNPGNIEDYEGKSRYQQNPLPLIAVPTTCGTGSEVTWVSVITNTERKFKMSIKGPAMFPAAALIDPDLLKTLPSSLVASTGLDALTHAVEAFTVKPATFITDVYAREAVRLIFQYLERAYRDIEGDDRARAGQMKGSLFAGLAFGNSDVGAVHCIAEAIGSLIDTPHGTANAVFLPYVMEYNLEASADRYAEIARIAGIDEKDNKAAARTLIRKIKTLSGRLGIPPARDLGIPEKDLPEIARKSFENNSNASNPRDMTAADYLQLMAKALA